ncbi:MAG: PfkB family carbohydrate kinase, partial [Candidatus Lutibacillus vidarii]
MGYGSRPVGHQGPRGDDRPTHPRRAARRPGGPTVILCVGLNPAIDITYRVDRLAPGEAHRVLDVRRRAGGKAVNVARGVQALGVAVTTLLPLGG